jgi:uncharacterized protein YciI
MFVAISQYRQPLDEVDQHRPDHKAWIAAGRDAGRIVLSGRQQPPDGGVIVFAAEDRGDAEAFMATDPFVIADVARYVLTEFEGAGPQVPGP